MRARARKSPVTYTGTTSTFQAAVESLFCTKKGILRRGTENGMTSKTVRDILRKSWRRVYKDETTYEQRISSGLILLQKRLLTIRHKEPVIFGYFRCQEKEGDKKTPKWDVAKYPERPDEVMDIITTYNRRSRNALRMVGFIKAVRERIDRLKGK